MTRHFKGFAIEFILPAGVSAIQYDASAMTLRQGDTVFATCKQFKSHWAWKTSGGGVLPKTITVTKAQGRRVLVTSGTPEAPGDGLLATMAGSFPQGAMTSDMCGDREFNLAASPVVGALPPADLALFLAVATCGCWQAAAHGTGFSNCYGNRGYEPRYS